MTSIRRIFMAAAACLAIAPGLAAAEIIWKGDFSTGNFLQYHRAASNKEVVFGQVPDYGEPIQYGGQLGVGDGSLLSLVSADGRTVNGVKYPVGPTRGSPYAAKFTVKNSASGLEPKDCDGSLCTRRRTELSMQAVLPDFYNAMPYASTRWIAFSVYVPADWEEGGSGWGPIVFQVKPRNENGSAGVSPLLSFGLRSGSAWTINHRWSPIENPTAADIPWQQQMFYTGNEGGSPYPRASNWPDGMKDFPDVAASHAALASVKKGGWTDWVVNLRYDARGASAGGTGFMTVWKRENSGSWVKVLHILPKTTTRGGMTFDHGIGYNSPANLSNNGGFGMKTGMYMETGQVWNLLRNRVLYLGNIKVGDHNTKFSEMSHDGSAPGQTASADPLPPKIMAVQ